MSRSLGHRNFNSEQEARDWLFDTMEHWDKQSWSHVFGVEGPAKNRWFADNFPVYQNRFGYWRLGRPLGTWAKEKRHDAYLRRKAAEDAEEKRREAQFKRDYPGWHYYPKVRRRKVQEYLSNMTSDFSDGTNGGDPVSRPPSTGDFGTSAGLPDYKYIERTHADKKERLRRLLARRDPGGISKHPYDVALRRSLGDSIEGEKGLGKELTGKDLVFRPQAEGPGRREHFLVELPDGQFLGVVFFDDLSPKQKTIPTLRRLWTEFPWVSIPRSRGDARRHRTKSDAIARVANFPEPQMDHDADFKRQDEIHAEEKAKMQEGDESFKDVFFSTPVFGWIARRKMVVSPTRFYYVYFARWTERNSNWSQYIGDSRIFKRKSSWMKWDGAKHGEWEIIPIYHDPTKYGERALEPEPPRRLLNYPKRPPDPDLPFGIGEAMDDYLVKDVTGPVDLTLEDFARNYKAVPFTGYARNAFNKYIFTKRLHVNHRWSQAFPNGGGHIWSLLRFKQDPERLLVMVPTDTPEFPGYPYDVIGYALTEEPGVPDSSIAIINDEILNQV